MGERPRRRPFPSEPAESKPVVSVVIPCYNYARFLPSAVESVLDQQGVEVEVVVVDDASTDDSVAVARRLAQAHRSITVVEHETNAGPVRTFNDGLVHVRGEFLVRLDADDMLTPGALARAVAVARRWPSVGLVYGHPVHMSDDSRSAARLEPTGVTVWPGRQWLHDRCSSGLNVITSPEVLMRMSLVDRLGGQEPLAHTHDMEMWLRLSAFCDVAYIHGADQAWHRDHSASLSAREVDPLCDLVERRAAFETLFSGPAGGIDGASRMHSAARSALAVDALQRARSLFDTREVDEGLVHRYLDFAAQTDPQSRNSRQLSRVTRRLGRGFGSPRRPTYVADRVLRRLRSERSWRRWHREGVY